MNKQKIESRENYFIFDEIFTRWMDNDAYGHVNNVTYYSYFDTVVNTYLIAEGGLDIQNDTCIGYVVNSTCNYLSATAYPDILDIGLRVDRIGNSSVQYGLAVFKKKQNTAAAFGHLVHVFVERESNKSVPIPEKLRVALEKILTERES